MNIIQKLSFRKDIKRHIIEGHTDLHSMIEAYDIDKSILFNDYCIEQKYDLAFHIYITSLNYTEIEADPVVYHMARTYCKEEYQQYYTVCNAVRFDEQEYETVCNKLIAKLHSCVDEIYNR